MKNRTFWILTISLAVLKLFIHFLTSTNYELHRDEMLYFAMGSHLSWGFASTPPFMSFLAFIVKNMFGYSEFFVKFFPAVAGSTILVLIALFIRQIGGKTFAVFSGCFAFLISTAMLRTASLFMPVIFELFFWMVFLFFVLKLIESQNPKYWILIGITFGLAFLNKYSILFLGFGTLIGFLLTEHRKLLNSKYLLYAIVAGLLIMLPNILWQINHGFAVVTHMSELYRTQLVYVSKLTFLLEQLLMNFNSLFIWLPGLIMVIFYRKESKYRIFGWIFLTVVITLLFSKGKPYYTLGVYAIMFAFGGYFLEKYLVGKLKFVAYGILVFSFISMINSLPFGLPVLPKKQMGDYCSFYSKYITNAPMRNENNEYSPIPQDYMDMNGWKELAEMVASTYNNLDSVQKNNCVIYANNYGQAAAIDFYGKKYNLPSPVCTNDSYIFWAPDSLTASTFIVTDFRLGDIPKLFESFTEVGEINDIYFRENGLKVYLCQKPVPELNEFFKQRIEEHKERYGY